MKGMIGGVYRDGYFPGHQLGNLSLNPHGFEMFAKKIKSDARNLGSRASIHSMMRKWTYYSINAGFSRETRRILYDLIKCEPTPPEKVWIA